LWTSEFLTSGTEEEVGVMKKPREMRINGVRRCLKRCKMSRWGGCRCWRRCKKQLSVSTVYERLGLCRPHILSGHPCRIPRWRWYCGESIENSEA
jgi:hypothetical protein